MSPLKNQIYLIILSLHGKEGKVTVTYRSHEFLILFAQSFKTLKRCFLRPSIFETEGMNSSSNE